MLQLRIRAAISFVQSTKAAVDCKPVDHLDIFDVRTLGNAVNHKTGVNFSRHSLALIH